MGRTAGGGTLGNLSLQQNMLSIKLMECFASIPPVAAFNGQRPFALHRRTAACLCDIPDRAFRNRGWRVERATVCAECCSQGPTEPRAVLPGRQRQGRDWSLHGSHQNTGKSRRRRRRCSRQPTSRTWSITVVCNASCSHVDHQIDRKKRRRRNLGLLSSAGKGSCSAIPLASPRHVETLATADKGAAWGQM